LEKEAPLIRISNTGNEKTTEYYPGYKFKFMSVIGNSYDC